MKKETDFFPSFAGGSRYYFDFGDCSLSNGFAQIDTEQDAEYFGMWANPFSLTIVSYIEGDVYRTTCDNEEEFIEEIKKIAKFHSTDFRGIDCGTIDKIEERFKELGLEEYLH